MKILSLAHALPSARLDLEWILAKLDRENTATLDPQDRARVLQIATEFLANCGSETRYQTTESERPIDLLLTATREALTRAQVTPRDVDFVVYAGVGRGWLEPATAHVVQGALGLDRASCFDILDGCASWMRALQVARGLLRVGEYRRGLIVNAECGFSAHGRWQFTSVEEFEDYVATYTIGEAATATAVGTSDADDDFYFRLESIGSAYDLCMIPLPNAADYMPECVGELPRTTKFYSRSKELMTTAINRIAESFRADPVLQSRTYDITFGHEASERATAAVTRILRQRPERHFAIHREYGNAVAASVPLAMSLALEQGRLERGHQVLIVVAASGITIGFAAFTF